ncbi:MAG: glycosyltransferase family 4 protein [Anaerolineae bacterium]
MKERLRHQGIEVVECHAQLWTGVEDRVDKASGGWRSLSFLRRVARAYWDLLAKYKRVGDYDVMILGYPGQFDAYVGRVLTWLRRKPLVLDVLMSLHLIATERGLYATSPLTSRLIYWAEAIAYRLPDLLIMDTPAYVDYLEKAYGVAPERFQLLPLGADDRLYRPLSPPPRDDKNTTKVVFYGTFIPLHGIEHIVRAAYILRHKTDIQFELIGRGPEKPAILALVEELELDNIHFTEWIPKEGLAAHIASADICLGVFGTTRQSLCTIQNKIYECLAMRKPLITGDCSLIRTAFTHGEHLYLCERANPEALADAILTLRDDAELRQYLAESGYRLFQAHYTIDRTSVQLAKYLYELVG